MDIAAKLPRATLVVEFTMKPLIAIALLFFAVSCASERDTKVYRWQQEVIGADGSSFLVEISSTWRRGQVGNPLVHDVYEIFDGNSVSMPYGSGLVVWNDSTAVPLIVGSFKGNPLVVAMGARGCYRSISGDNEKEHFAAFVYEEGSWKRIPLSTEGLPTEVNLDIEPQNGVTVKASEAKRRIAARPSSVQSTASHHLPDCI